MSLNAENKKNNTLFWDNCRGKVLSRNGGWIMGKGVFCHGFDMMEELVGKISYFQFLILNALGRLPDRPLADWLEASYICMSWPDPRIWCNQVGALGGTMRSSAIAATTAGVLTAVSRTYGPKSVYDGVEFIQAAMEKRKQGLSVAEIVAFECKRKKGKPNIIGFARPIAKGDERVERMEKVTAELGFPIGEHMALAYEIEKNLMDEFNEGMNFTGYASAFFADQGIGPEDAFRILTVLVSSGVTACYVDAAERPAESFLPMRCEDMDYQGKPPRPVPEKE